MEFKATVTLVDTPGEQAAQRDTDKARDLIMQAFQILSNTPLKF